MADTAPAAVEAPPPPPAPEAPPALTAEQQAVLQQQQQQAAALAAQQQQFYYAADPNIPNPYYANVAPMYAANYGYYGGPPVMYPGYAPTLLPPAGDAPQRTRRRRRGSARGRRGGRRDGDNGDAAAADENGDASPRAAPAETPAFSAADFPSLGVATGIKEQAQQWVTPAAPVTAQTIGQEPPAAVAAAPASTEPIKTPPPPPHKPKDGRKCGVCAWFEPSKKMGFIRQDEGGDIFVHASDLRDGVSIEEGDRVEYAVAQFKDRNKAIDVVPISQIVSTTPEEDASDGTQEEEVPVFDATDFPSLGGTARPAQPAAWGAAAPPSSLTAPPVVAPAPLVTKRPVPPPSPPRPASTNSGDGEKKDQGISQKRKTGVCLWYILKKRHGFIKPDEGGASDIFVHASDLRDGAIEEGDRVEYAVAKFKDRVKAVDVTVVAPAPAAAA